MKIFGRLVGISAPCLIVNDEEDGLTFTNEITFVLYHDGKNEMFFISSEETGFDELSISNRGDYLNLYGEYVTDEDDEPYFNFTGVENQTLNIGSREE